MKVEDSKSAGGSYSKRKMKENLICPISHRGCILCSLYRGRHYNLPFCKASSQSKATRNRPVASKSND